MAAAVDVAPAKGAELTEAERGAGREMEKVYIKEVVLGWAAGVGARECLQCPPDRVCVLDRDRFADELCGSGRSGRRGSTGSGLGAPRRRAVFVAARSRFGSCQPPGQ